MRKLTGAQRRGINRRIRYLCSKQREARSLRACAREYGPIGSVRSGVCYNEPRIFLFLGCPIEVNRGSGGFQHVRDTIFELFKQANDESEATAQLLEVGR